MNSRDLLSGCSSRRNLHELPFYLLLTERFVNNPKTVWRLRMMAHIVEKVAFVPNNSDLRHPYPLHTK